MADLVLKELGPKRIQIPLATSPVHLTTVLRRAPQTADINDKSFPIPGVELDFLDVKPAIASYRRMVRGVEFDMCALAPTTYYIARAYGAPFKALPIFASRRFHHAGLLVRPDAGINGPKDLIGKKVGVRAYSVTTGVWTRGILENEYGVKASDINWVVDDEEHVTKMPLPPFVSHVPEGKSLASMMASGEIQAGFAANAGIGREGKPTEGWEAKERPEAKTYRELFPNAAELGAEWYKRTGILPFHGVIVIKDDILKKHPWIAKSVYEAFYKSKENWLKKFKSGEANSKDDEKYRKLVPIIGEDPMPYGIKANLPSINALIDYAVQQRLMPKRLSVEELFIDPDA